MKKSYLLCFALFIGFISCNTTNENQDIYSKEYNIPLNIEESPSNPYALPPGLVTGKIISPILPDSMKIEKNMLSQMQTYIAALSVGNIDEAFRYTYPEAFKYFRGYFPDMSNDAVKEFMFEEASKFREAIEIFSDKGIHIEIIPAQLIRKIQSGDNIIIVYSTTSNVFSEKVYSHFDSFENNIAISQDGGKHWTFMTEYEATPTILRMKFPNQIVNEIMGY